MKKVISLLIVAVMLMTTAFAHPFTDMAEHWAEAEIEKAYTNGFINGDGDGTFRPDDSVSRAEFVKMVAALMAGKMGGEVPDEFGDTTHWASKYYNFSRAILYAPLTEEEKVNGIVPGLFKTAVEYELPIQRWEMAFMMAQAMTSRFGIADGSELEAIEEIEGAYPEAVANAIKSCVDMGLMKGDESGKLNANDGGTRAEAATLINRMNEKIYELIEAYETAMDQAEAEQLEALEESKKTYENIPKGHPVVTVEMENGKKFKIELYPEYAPQTVANFVALVKDGFYDGLTFHRIVEGFVAQGGDPNGDGSGQSEHTIVGEFAANDFEGNTLSHERGVVSMARSQFADSASCQFFICLDDATSLDGNYAAFGKVIDGMEVVDAFLEVERADNGTGEVSAPTEPIVMKKVTVK